MFSGLVTREERVLEATGNLPGVYVPCCACPPRTYQATTLTPAYINIRQHSSAYVSIRLALLPQTYQATTLTAV
jgi:hypothetical protein